MKALARVAMITLMLTLSAGALATGSVHLQLGPRAVEHAGIYEEFSGQFRVFIRLTEACAEELGDFTAANVDELLELRITESLNVTARIMGAARLA